MVFFSCWTFRIFLFLSARGEGKGKSVAPGRGRFSIENPREGVFSRERGEGRGAGRVSAGNFGGELNIFFGAEMPTKFFISNDRMCGQKVSRRKKAHKHKLFALVNVQMALGQTAGCPRANRAKKLYVFASKHRKYKFFCSLWLTGGLSQGCPDFQKVYVFKVYVPFSWPILEGFLEGNSNSKCSS